MGPRRPSQQSATPLGLEGFARTAPTPGSRINSQFRRPRPQTVAALCSGSPRAYCDNSDSRGSYSPTAATLCSKGGLKDGATTLSSEGLPRRLRQRYVPGGLENTELLHSDRADLRVVRLIDDRGKLYLALLRCVRVRGPLPRAAGGSRRHSGHLRSQCARHRPPRSKRTRRLHDRRRRLHVRREGQRRTLPRPQSTVWLSAILSRAVPPSPAPGAGGGNCVGKSLVGPPTPGPGVMGSIEPPPPPPLLGFPRRRPPEGWRPKGGPWRVRGVALRIRPPPPSSEVLSGRCAPSPPPPVRAG